jgi:hypothetical protein
MSGGILVLRVLNVAGGVGVSFLEISWKLVYGTTCTLYS